MIPQIPDGFPRCHKPCLWVPPPRIGAPKREREGHVAPEDEEMDDPDPKRRTSAADKEDQDMEDPAPEHRPSTVEFGGQYGTATHPQLNVRYSLGKIA